MYSTSKNWDNDSCTTQTCFRANICDVASEAIEVNYFEAAKELCISVEPLKKFQSCMASNSLRGHGGQPMS